MSAKKKSKISQDTKDFIKELKKVEETKVETTVEDESSLKTILKDKKKDLKEVLSNTKNKAKESLNVEVNLDEIKETNKVIKDKVKDLPSGALDTIQTKVIDKVQDAATDYAVSKVFKGNFFKRLIESVINKLKKI
jgi:D-alanyl-D-alanine carboxypeptidase